jgi:hypothetical protein
MKDRLLELDGMLRKNPIATTKDFIDEIQNLWTEFGLLMSNVLNTACIDRYEEVSVLQQETKKYVTSWNDLIHNIEAIRNKLNTVLSKGLMDQVYEHSERLFILSDERDNAIKCFKVLIKDLKHTEKGTDRYENLDSTIDGLFESFNILLQITARTLTSAGLEIKTSTYNFSEITREEIGL